MRGAIYSVGELAAKLKGVLESSFYLVWVTGEVTGVRETAAGHVYFTLKDEQAQLSCVWFSGRRRQHRNFDPLTGEVYAPGQGVSLELLKAGGEFLCSGKLSFYPKGGSCQLVVEHVIKRGVGALTQAFEAAKQELARLGYFALERKRPIPVNPRRVALITSETGAAIRDFLTIASGRGLSSRIRLFPTLVQGQKAAAEIAQAIELAASQHWAEVIVLIRGGGSLEDLFCFNERRVADAVFRSPLPVLAGIGHEIDVTLADMTADLRAATPTHAAELLYTPREDFARALELAGKRLLGAVQSRLQYAEQKLAQEERSLIMLSPVKKIERLSEGLSTLLEHFRLSIVTFLRLREEAFRQTSLLFWQLMSPKRFEARFLRLSSLQERLGAQIQTLLETRLRLLEGLTERLVLACARKLESEEHLLSAQISLLESVNPLALLERGYALVLDRSDHLVRSVAELSCGSEIAVRLYDGRLTAAVRTVEKIPLSEG